MKVDRPLDWDVLRKDVDELERSITGWEDGPGKARARFLLSAKGQPLRPKAPARFPLAATGATFVLAAGIALAFIGRQPRRQVPVSFEIGTEHRPGDVGALLAPTGPEPMAVRFSDGASLAVAPATRARVTNAGTHGVTVLLEDGSLSVAVVHHDATRWQVAAGPFTVVVTGTLFDVRWSAAEQTLALDLHEGSVTVLGPSLGPTGRRLSRGESLHVSVAEAPAVGLAPTAPAGEKPPRASAARGDGAKAAPADLAQGPRSTWKGLALGARYTEALAAAEQEGFDAVCRRASAADLLLLGDAARFAGSTRRAEQALQLVRAMSGAKHEAAMSAFALGRIAYDEHQRYREASRWFQSYLREEPSGGLAREAAGRLIEAQQAAGDLVGANESANVYLNKYPTGPHAPLARIVINR